MAVRKIRPDAEVYWDNGADGRDGAYRIKYTCPVCGKKIYRDDIACDECGTFFDWSMKAEIVVTRSIVWRG